ncbi:hypothetical protein HRR79_005199 [Exophiala dermatitidis]|nr:hypothetical protein HRR79_005199 [Exophiala dermatitidis]
MSFLFGFLGLPCVNRATLIERRIYLTGHAHILESPSLLSWNQTLTLMAFAKQHGIVSLTRCHGVYQQSGQYLDNGFGLHGAFADAVDFPGITALCKQHDSTPPKNSIVIRLRPVHPKGDFGEAKME